MKLRSFEHNALHRPRAAQRTLSEWAGQVWHQDRYSERYGYPGTESPESRLARQRLLAVIRARLPHLKSDVGDGRSCDCRYLRLALGAFDRDRLAITRRRYLTASAAILHSALGFLVLILAFWYLHRASALSSDRAFGFMAGISGGLVVATIQMVVAITMLLTDRVAETVEWRWFHPDSDWRLIGTLSPRHRRRIRHAHLLRAASVVLQADDQQPSNRPPVRGFAARIYRAYAAFRSGTR
jgi:hypothetical protein